jgi:septum site-determining protein MinD
MGKVIVFTSGKGGTGKTTSAAALASALAARGMKILCIDADAGLKNLDLSLGLSETALCDFCDVLDGRCSFDEAVYEHPAIPGLFFLTAPTLVHTEDINASAFNDMLSSVRDRFDFCFIDSPAGIGSGFRLSAQAADAAIIVSTSDASSSRDAQRIVMELRAMGISNISLIVNRVRPKIFRISKLDVDDLIDTVGAKLIGLIPEDRAVILAANLGVPLLSYTSKGAAAAFTRIAGRLLGERVSITGIKPAI